MENEILTPIDDEKIIQELTCPICLSILNDPILTLPNEHIFCSKCFESYLIKNNLIKVPICPICKTQIESTMKPKFINNILSTIKMKCCSKTPDKQCNFIGNSLEYYSHIKNCDIFKESIKNKLEEIVKKMKDILDKEINPHLKAEHLKIYEEYVDDWKWLVDVNKDWKWWWWSDNEWWGNKSCLECNILWHKYEDEIQVYESQRVSLLSI